MFFYSLANIVTVGSVPGYSALPTAAIVCFSYSVNYTIVKQTYLTKNITCTPDADADNHILQEIMQHENHSALWFH